jgi:DNA polymerase-3 subunit gamma/tau
MNELFASPAEDIPVPAPLVEYRVLARKYRPGDFASLLGQEAMVRTLGNAIRRGQLAQAWLLTGVRGVGKTSTARIIAKALNWHRRADDRAVRGVRAVRRDRRRTSH